MSELHEKASMYCNHPTASKPAKAIIRDLLAENERLQSRLRELASAEPVAYTDVGENSWSRRETEWHNIALIRRPEMPS